MLFASRRALTMALGLIVVIGAARSDVRAAPSATNGSTPVIMSVVPAIPVPDKNPQVLRISGQEFQPRLKLMVTTPAGNSIELKEGAIQAQRESSFQVAVPMTTAGKYSLVVTNPDGGISAPFVLEVRAIVKVPTPVIQRIQPEEIRKSQEPQDLTVEGRNFGPGVRVTLTDPLGVEVINPVVKDVTPTLFRLTVKLETPGPYNMVVSNATGAVSNVATIVVK